METRRHAPPGDRAGSPERWRTVLLAAGALAGVLAAAVGVLHTQNETPRADAVARVNGAIIRREDLERVLRVVAPDDRAAADASLRARTLEHLIEEELLVQRGIELGLVRQDRKVRADLTRAMIDAAVAGAQTEPPSEAALQAFYDEHQDLFAPTGRLRLRQVFVRAAAATDDATARERARRAAEQLRTGADFTRVRDELGDREVAPIPDALLPRAKLLDYVGPAVVLAAAALAPGAVADPVRSSGGYHVVQLLERQAGPAPPLAKINDRVLAEYRRRAGDNALRSYLQTLRERAEIVVNERGD